MFAKHPRAKRIIVNLVAAYLVFIVLMALFQRFFLYHPAHRPDESGLQQWTDGNGYIGCKREVASPRHIWLVLHGNRGQASDKVHVLGCIPREDSVYLMEYPGFGPRSGHISRTTIDTAAEDAYALLRRNHPGVPLVVLGESIGSGPACHLATMPVQPDKIILAVPFDNFPSLVQERMPYIPARWILLDRWDNVNSLQGYPGKVEIYAANNDRVIPNHRAKALAQSHPGATFRMLDGLHKEWWQNVGMLSGE
jgi:uncharacterized protein